ncbi:methyltransferase domain-containing protein [Myxococcus sp. K15C18031901]|uniref:class I SAM-dependent methyltransferase n=1 Tax=Myxococcus dinghuensis TaxID=2906761 RepID=UPI0020A7DC67|nr:class I SAM-dependent methyltransferase [Myxococcus dinghuensis]MCP3105294.1 methyltransferase domain-containing protein [Myxococcus dinghuensis]
MSQAPESDAVRREFFRSAYLLGAPWDIGRPQRAFVELWEAGEVAGEVLDVGCGFAENALFLAARGLRVCGVDMMEPAIVRAREAARARGLDVSLQVGNALALETLGRRFDTVLDSALLHVFEPEDRHRFAASLARVLRSGGRYHALYFREGPRAVSPADLRAAFSDGWRVRRIQEAHYEQTDPEGARAWLATVERE